MKCLALATLAITLTVTTALRGSTGKASELAFPQGTLALSSSRQAIAISASHILVGLPGASYRTTREGPVLGGAGEEHVFSTVTGQFLRRLRPVAPAASAAFGSVVAVQDPWPSWNATTPSARSTLTPEKPCGRVRPPQ